jgi:Tol biopolymer transport system component
MVRRSFVLVLAAVVLVAVPSALGAGPPPPTGTIVVSRDLDSDDDRGDELFAVDVRSGAERNLTNHPAVDEFPAISSRGDVAFSSDRDGNSELYVLHKNGALRRVTRTASFDEFTPAWSPDGKKLAFTRAPAGGLDACLGPPFTGCATFGIYVMGADGTGAPQLLSDAAGVDESGPRWSPNGKRISFTSDRTGDYEVWVVKADGTGETNLTNSPTTIDGFTWPPASWSPDGRRLAFGRTTAFDFSLFESEIHVMHADGSNVQQLTDAETQGTAFTPVWSPNGRQIAFVRFFAGGTGGDLFVMHADGTGQQTVKNTPEPEHSYDWGR